MYEVKKSLQKTQTTSFEVLHNKHLNLSICCFLIDYSVFVRFRFEYILKYYSIQSENPLIQVAFNVYIIKNND